MRLSVPLVALVFLAVAFAGCVAPAAVDPASLVPARGFDTSRGWSMPLSPEVYARLPVEELRVPSFDGTEMAVAVHRPDVPPDVKVPVVMDAGPYWADHIDREGFRPPLVEWLVPRGYAVAYMSVRGTGESGGCMETMSLNEQKDVDAVVTWLAEQEWSSGNVGMMGRSYDGTTPYFPAALGNPHLKTIVPISSVPSEPELLFKNGTTEQRGPIFTNGLYWGGYGLGALDGGAPGYRAGHFAEQACSDVVLGVGESFGTAATGDASSQYWQDRHFKDRVLANYNGSIWFVHGLEDWNVNPSQVVPWYQDLEAKGLDVKMWLGVWAHAYPDRVDEHRNVRWDWAEQTVRWFDFYLKDVGPKPELGVEVEDSLYVWRKEATYPPRDAVFVEFEPGNDGVLAARDDAAAGVWSIAPQMPRSWQSEPLASDIRIAGLPQFHATVTPLSAEGGYLFAELHDVFPDGRSVRIGWAAIDVAHHAGGNGAPATLTPREPVLALMEFEPMDAHVARGHALRLVVHRDGVEDIVPSPEPATIDLLMGEGQTLLRIPTVERPDIVPSYTAPGLES